MSDAPKVVGEWCLDLADEQRMRLMYAISAGGRITVQLLDDDTVTLVTGRKGDVEDDDDDA